MVTDIGPATVNVMGQPYSARYCFQRKTCYAANRHWAFYIENIIKDGGDTLVYSSSDDGLIWAPSTMIRPATDGGEFSMFVEEFLEPGGPPQYYVHYCWADHDGDSELYYRRGELKPDGTIDWDTDEQIAEPIDPGYSYINPTICTTDLGLPFIGFTKVERGGAIGIPYVTGSLSAPIWQTRLQMPYALDEDPSFQSWIVIVLPMGSNITAVFTRDNGPIVSKYYDEILGWGPTDDSGKLMGSNARRISATSRNPDDGGEVGIMEHRVHVAWQDANEDLQHMHWGFLGSWSVAHLIYNGDHAIAPAITVQRWGSNPMMHHHRTLYVFWTPITDDPVADYVCYMLSPDEGENWYNEAGDVTPELWIDETGLLFPGVNILSVYFHEYHKDVDASNDKGYIGVLWTGLGLSPDHVRYAALEFDDPSSDLPAEFVIDHVVDLFAEFLMNQSSASSDLPAQFEVGQDSGDLPAEFVIDHIIDLFAEFGVAHWEELFAKALLRHSQSAALLGEFVVLNAETHSTPFCKFVVRHDGVPLNLLGEFIARHMAAPLGIDAEFDVGHSAQISKGLEAGVYRDMTVIR